LLGGRVTLDSQSAAVSVAVTAAVLALGLWYFRRMEHSFADSI
jgi:ABC-type polysaccharide/polyol phosphate export permease